MSTRHDSAHRQRGNPIEETERLHRLCELADTQAALKRLAVLIARNDSPTEVFAAVTKEIRRRFGSVTARMIRFESHGTATIVANEGTAGPHVRVGEEWTNFPERGLTCTVWRTGRPARVDDYREVPGGEVYLTEGLLSAVAVPVYVSGSLWGLIAIGSGTGPLPADAEERLSEFTGLTATAIATAQSRAELIASRARIVAAADEARERIERNLHDGAQQQLVTLALRIATLTECPDLTTSVRGELQTVLSDLRTVLTELREIARGIHPAVLSEAGLGPALRSLASRSALPLRVRVDVPGRLAAPVEVGAYYVVSESLTNAVKLARATHAEVSAVLDNEVLCVHVADDGIGGAVCRGGSGLLGLQDRVEALGGRLLVDSPLGGGTRIHCEIPAGKHGAGRAELSDFPGR
ncbi:GAF domain-containing protein [Mycolicibacterium litorale]|uniref:histidine kinase n=2 Tax=Mycolicibacterium litorale TaxID=758802 RepID=A0AAD1MWA7_9MYCO|nr:GAF domain-containing protein [Mycolicibacterium litorale]TDY04709.1 histidine kinase [Mycolicibacterium litorale]BBY18136.1 histidine kinase [Mycolicibacterium litorale]